jgi:hypothetical protein
MKAGFRPAPLSSNVYLQYAPISQTVFLSPSLHIVHAGFCFKTPNKEALKPGLTLPPAQEKPGQKWLSNRWLAACIRLKQQALP